MSRDFNLKRRESETLPTEKLHQILSGIYSEKTVNELMDKLVGKKRSDNNGE